MVTTILQDGNKIEAANLVTDLAAANATAIAATFTKTDAGGLVTKAESLYQIEEGNVFSAYYTVTTAETDALRTAIYMKMPAATTKIYCVPSFSASGAAKAEICEAPTVAADTGTAHTQVIYNRNRNSSATSLVLDNDNPQVVNKFTGLAEAAIAGDGTWATGTIVRSETLVAGAAPRALGGVAGEQPYLLKAATAYVFLITNVGATANIHKIYVDWVEVT